MNIWIEGSRPKTLIASLSPVLIGTVIPFKEGFFDPILFLLTTLFACSIQIGTNLANDYFDFCKGADTKKRKGPRRLCQSGLICPEKVKKGAIYSFTLALIFSLYLMIKGGWVIVFLSFLSIFLGYIYTGGSFPLSYLGISDFFVLLFFGPIAVCGTLYLQTGHVSIISVVAGFAPGFISTAILTSNNLRDLEEDRLASKKSLVVRFGSAFGRLEYGSCLCGAALIPLVLVALTKTHYGCLLATCSFLFALPLIKNSYSKKELISLIDKTGRWMILYTATFLIGWCL